MQLSEHQQQAIDRGEAVRLMVAGRACVLVSQEVYEHVRRSGYDDSLWTDDEMDLLAAEDADRLGWAGMDVYQDES